MPKVLAGREFANDWTLLEGLDVEIKSMETSSIRAGWTSQQKMALSSGFLLMATRARLEASPISLEPRSAATGQGGEL